MKLSRKSKNKIQLIGNNLSSSKSLNMHNAIYERFGLPFEYCLSEFKTVNELCNYLNNINDDFFAANITYPYKSEVINILNCNTTSSDCVHTYNAICDEAVGVIGGANLIVKHINDCFLYNFDGLGLVAAFQNLDKSVFQRINNSRVVIFGSGVTAHSLDYAFKKFGTTDVYFVERENHVYSEKTAQMLNSADFVINATPVGKFSDNYDENLMDNYQFSESQIVIDVVYRDDLTPFLQMGKKSGCQIFDGRFMLAGQAALTVLEICKNFNVATQHKFNFDTIFDVAFDAIKID